MEVVRPADECELYCGDARAVLPTLPAGTFDACICDPPYPMIKRPYGRLTEAEWFDLMRAVVPEVRRVLKPRGSAVFVLQPNSERVGRMRTWLWDFLAWVGREWGVVQDAYWWNYTAITTIGASKHGLMRPSLKTAVWVGPENCYRCQKAALWDVSPYTLKQARQAEDRFKAVTASGHGMNRTAASEAAIVNGGSTPLNLMPVSNARGHTTAGAHGHGAGTPLAVCDWWVRYLVPPGGAVLDPFAGSGTVGMAALRRGCTFVGIEKESAYVEIARKRLAEAQGPLFPVREDKA
jgi:DNA modification methylase